MLASVWLFQFTRPQGARLNPRRSCTPGTSFNSRARKGRDFAVPVRLVDKELFQFTRPQGARPAPAAPVLPELGFNSRARKGRDGRDECGDAARTSFNSRARKGRDVDVQAVQAYRYHFNSRARKGRDSLAESSTSPSSFQFTRPQGARQLGRVLDQPVVVSIHAPARGATGGRDSRAGAERVSIHAPARGATSRPLRETSTKTVSIHAPARGATDEHQEFAA